MSRLYVPGPGEIYVGTGGSGALLFLGTTQNGPMLTYRRGQEPVIVDLSGPIIPFDLQHMGMEAFIRAEVAVFNWNVLETVMPSLRGDTFGEIEAGDIGIPIFQADLGHRLMIYYPNGGIAMYPNMPRCRNFPTSTLMDSQEPVSTRFTIVPLVWHALAKLDTATGAGTLLNADFSGKPAPD